MGVIWIDRPTGLQVNTLNVVPTLVQTVDDVLAKYTDLEMAARASGARADEAMSSYGTLLSTLVDPQRFPAIGALVDSGVFEGSDAEDAEFAFGLERILDGLAALMPERAR
jgi:hypothetical protein